LLNNDASIQANYCQSDKQTIAPLYCRQFDQRFRLQESFAILCLVYNVSFSLRIKPQLQIADLFNEFLTCNFKNRADCSTSLKVSN